MNNRLDPRKAFGDVIASQLHSMASDYEHLARQLRQYADRVSNIGDNTSAVVGEAVHPLTASGIAINAVQDIHRYTPQLTGMLRAAADYDRDVPGFLKEDR